MIETLDLLDTARSPQPIHKDIGDLKLVYLDIKIACSPHVPLRDAGTYLHNVSTMVDELSAPEQSKRKRAVFEVIVKEFPDSARVYGINWWDAWQATKIGNDLDRAKL